MAIGGPVFHIFKDFLTNHQRVSVDGNFNEFKSVVSDVPQDSVLSPLLFIVYTTDMWNDLEKKIISYADDTTFYAEVASPCIIGNNDLSTVLLFGVLNLICI